MARPRWVRVVTRGAVGLVALLVVALLVTQTPWFRDWLRRTAMRQAERVIEGQLVIGRLEGTLFTGVTLRDVSVVQQGAAVVAIDRVSVSYGLGELLSDGRVVAHLAVDRPVVRVVRTPTGWNVARLLRPRPPGEPGAPRPTFALPDIVVTGGLVTVEAGDGEPPAALPRRIEALDMRLGIESVADALRIDVRALSLRAERPDLDLRAVSGRVVNDADGWHLGGLDVTTAESRLRVDGSVTRPAPASPVHLALDVAGAPLSLPEIGRFVPAVEAIALRPTLDARVTGTLDALRVAVTLDSDAGRVQGPVTIDATGPARAVAGTLEVRGLDLAPWIAEPDATGRITGTAVFDLRFPSGTPGVALDGTFRFRGPEAGAYGYAATDVVADGRLRGRRIELTAEASAYGGRATTRGTIDRPGPGQREVVLALAGRVQDMDLRRLPATLPMPDIETRLAATYTVAGPLSRVEATATLEDSEVEGATLAPGLVASYARRPDGFSFEAAGDVDGIDLPRLGRALDLDALQADRYAGVVRGQFVVAGTRQDGEPFRLTTSGTVRDSRIWNGDVPDMVYDATLVGDRLDVTARGHVAAFDLAELSGIDALTGRIGGAVDARVTFRTIDDVSVDTVDVEGTVTLARPVLMDVPFAQVVAEVHLADGLLDVRSVEGIGQGFTVSGQGVVALGDSGASDFRYSLEATSLIDPARVADLPLTGAATAEGTLTGPREAFRVTGTVQGTDVAYDDVVGMGTVTARYRVEVPDFDPDRLRVEADVSSETLDVGGLALTMAAGTLGYEPGLLTFDATTRDASRTLRAVGTMALDEGRQVITMPDLRLSRDDVQWALATGERAVVTLTTEALDVEPVRLVNGAQAIDIDGRLALDAATENALRLRAEGVAVAEALVLADVDVDADGRVTLDARIGGTRAVPSVSGRLEVRDGRYRDLAIETVTATVVDDGQLAEVDVLVRQSDTAYLTATGVVPRTLFASEDETTGGPVNAAGDRLDLAIRSTSIDLRLAEGLTDQVRDVTGQAQLDIRLTNSGRTPIVAGRVTLADAGFLVAATGVTYRNANGTLDFVDDRVVVRQLSAESRDGRTIEVAGEVGLREASAGALALRITGAGVRVLDNELGQMDLDTTLTVTGSLEAPAIEGDLVVVGGRLEVDALLPRFATGAYATQAAYQGIPTYADEDAFPVVPNILEVPSAPAAGETPTDAPSRLGFVYDDLALNIRVRVPDNLLLRGRDVEVARSSIGDVNVTMGGDFRIAKSVGEPLVLVGAVNTVRGTYSYQGRRFDIARDGQVLFRGDGTTNPSLDITAERVIQGVQARVRIQGTAEDPTLTLSSDPPLDEADVLALIVFNQPVNQLGTGQQNSLAQRAGGVAAGFAVSPIAQALGDTLDLDLFDVETTDPAGRVNPAVVIGQQVNQSLFVKFRQQFGNQQVSQFLLEYRLADFLRLQANVAEGDGLARGNRSLTQRIERYGADLVFYFAF